MRIFVTTWNTHGKEIIPEIPKDDFDMVIISLQECYSPLAVDPGTKYKFTIVESLYGLQTVVLSKKIVKYKVNKVGFGPLGFPNKGFISIRINDSLLYMNAHLSAHENKQMKRMSQISKMLRYTYDINIDTIILSGDLNFRTVNGIDQGKDLFKNYKNFIEAPIKFKPTYKYEGDSLSLKRTPSYCDRIIIGTKRSYNFIEYCSNQNIDISDHKPVYLKLQLDDKKHNTSILDVKFLNLYFNEKVSRVYHTLWVNRGHLIFILTIICFVYMYGLIKFAF